MSLIPLVILRRIEEFVTSEKTGQIALNIFEGKIINADVKEQVKAVPKKILDK